jgi:hypothetical protein
MRGYGRKSPVSFTIRSHVVWSCWLRRRSERYRGLYMSLEHQQGAEVGRHCVVGEIAGDDLAEPGPPFGIDQCICQRNSP